MTRDQLFALPVGTRLMFVDNEMAITSRDEDVVTFQFDDGETVRVRRDYADQITDLLEVIPGELDASEGVE